MFFRQLIDADLGCASYVIADAGEAIVVYPSIAIDEYLELATRHPFGIVHIVETHTHADHVSGNRRLAAAHRRRHPRQRWAPARVRERHSAPRRGDRRRLGRAHGARRRRAIARSISPWC